MIPCRVVPTATCEETSGVVYTRQRNDGSLVQEIAMSYIKDLVRVHLSPQARPALGRCIVTSWPAKDR